jgi:hypothetical protein
MSSSQATDYRDRLYERYVSSREGTLAPPEYGGIQALGAFVTVARK